MLTVIDLSHHNLVQDLKAAKAAGVRGVIHKATEGNSFIDDKLKARRHLAMEAGLLWGIYHFVRPGEMQRQVDHFVDTAEAADAADENTLWALDYEDDGVSIDDAAEFMRLLELEINRSPVIYSGHVLKEKITDAAIPKLSEYRLWLAQYGSKAELPKGWKTYYLWQYTDQGEVAGITPPTDLNRYDDSIEELARTWSGKSEEEPVLPPIPLPVPEPELEPQTVTITIRVEVPTGVKIALVQEG